MHHPGFTPAEHPGRLALRWTLAGSVVLAVHGLVAIGLLRSATPIQDPGEPPAAVMVDLAPLAAAPPSEASDEDTTPGEDADTQPAPTEQQPPEPAPVPAEPRPEEATRQPPPEPLPDPVVELPEPAPTPDFAELVTPAQVAALDMLPPPPDVPTPEVMLPAPTPPQRPPELTPPEKPKTAAVQPRMERRPPPPQQRRTRGSLAPQENEAAAPAAPREGSAPVSGQTKMEWAGKVVAHLRRHIRYPDRARAGTVTGSAQLLLRLDAAGNVLAVRIAASSGSPILDAAIIDGARQASPVPSPPPAVMQQATLNVRVPVNFTLR
ncbi:TonB family protein [Chelatococcus sp. XZ-Ab1]|uniref:TonB family protein n=1 Tax=Chelatococcus sp. XZ-Ab1 TaxID=3034027 RepID=UPI0023E38A48|nr:TonB family protein [Chelatococcus sp. XZ-Ab1]